MRQFVSKVRNLSQKAAGLKAAMQQLPPKVAEVRETIAATAGQLQRLKMDVQSTVADLKADSDQRISQAMQEINASLDVFLAAGFELNGVDLEISPVERLLVRLNKQEEVHPSKLRSLISANQPRKTTHALLEALLQAHAMAETVDMPYLDYAELVVGIGPIPSVRICWRAKEAGETSTIPETAQTTPAASPDVLPKQETPSIFGQGSFFEKPTSSPLPVSTSEMGSVAPTEQSVVTESKPAAEPLQPVTSPASTFVENPDPLARFKKMPDLTKHRR